MPSKFDEDNKLQAAFYDENSSSLTRIELSIWFLSADANARGLNHTPASTLISRLRFIQFLFLRPWDPQAFGLWPSSSYKYEDKAIGYYKLLAQNSLPGSLCCSFVSGFLRAWYSSSRCSFPGVAIVLEVGADMLLFSLVICTNTCSVNWGFVLMSAGPVSIHWLSSSKS